MTEKNTSSCEQKTSLQIKDIRRVTWVGLLLNVLLSAFKIAAGTVGASQAVVADGVHSLSDTTTDLAVLIGVRYWTSPPDQTHPHGHSRIETLITVFIGFALATVALGLGYNALTTLNVKHSEPPGMIALIAALVSIISKEILYRWNVSVGTRIKSPAVIANAWHHRSDGLSSIPVAIAVAGARFAHGWYFLDHVGAALVSVFILQSAWKIAWPALSQLTDSGGNPEVCRQIEKLSLDIEGVIRTHKCRTRYLGIGLQVDIHILVKPDITVREGHDISEAVKQRLLKEGPDVVDAIIHMEPYEKNAELSSANW